MRLSYRIMCYYSLILAMALYSCAPSASQKPDPKAGAGGSTGKSAADARAGEGSRGGAKEADTDQSSLKQFQEGKSPITPP